MGGSVRDEPSERSRKQNMAELERSVSIKTRRPSTWGQEECWWP